MTRADGEPRTVRPERSREQSAAPLARTGRALRSLLFSYRLRVLAWFVGLLALGTIATVVVLGQVVLQGTDERVRSDLIQESEEFASLVGGTDPETGQPFGVDVQRIFDVFLDRNVAARNEVVLTFVDGAFHRRSRPEPPIELQLEPGFVGEVATIVEPNNARYVSSVGAVDYLAVPVKVEGATRGVFVVAAFRDLERAEQDDILRAVTTVGLVLLVIGSILAWRLADRVLAPVRRTTATARSISETDLNQRVVVEGDDEVAELAQTLNDMLDRVSTAIEEQRRFMDDAGHELRTPLTIARGHLELVEEGDPDEVRRTVYLVIDEVDRMTRIVNDLVVLAAATRPDFVRRTTFSVAELMHNIFDKARVLGPRDWRLNVSGDINLSADRQRLTQAVLQLAQNACQHTSDGDVIELGSSTSADRVRLWVHDSGRGIAADQQEAIFRRFYRLEDGSRSSSGHTGLGLAIVSAIAEAHGGTVSVASEPGAGARFTLSIPVQPREARRSP